MSGIEHELERQAAAIRRLAAVLVRDANTADDLTQDVYLRAWSKLHTFRGEAAFTTWLHRLAVNLILGRRETLQRREARLLAGDGLLDGLAARVALPGFRMDFERAVEHLPPRARTVFVLY
ncbi:MAG: RNA polymerase sigma factor, partial [Planctomycetes bacterium]|nr:RNA polymerase sigma factor [Planctomycetota bacterium]